MKNYSEQIRVSAIDSTAFDPNTANTVLDSDTDVKIEKSKVVDTSGDSTGAFDGLTAGDVIYMSGWDNVENNGVFTVVETENNGSKLTLDYPLLKEGSPSTGGITMYQNPQEEDVSGVEVSTCIVVGVTDVGAVGNTVFDGNLFKVTDDDVVSHFAETGGNALLMVWADLTKG